MNLDLLRSFVVVVELGSLNRAAERLRASQSTLTRQIQALEREVGGRLLDRTSSGVALTALGHALLESIRPALAQFDQALEGVRRLARGQLTTLRIGYLPSAAADFLNGALATLRHDHPEVKVKLFDLSPGEQIERLRKGELEVALVGCAGSLLAREFYTRRLTTRPVLVALSATHPLAALPALRLIELKRELFVGALEQDMPGYNRWITQAGRRAGFRPKFVQDAESLNDSLATVVTENAVALVPDYVTATQVPGVTFRPLSDRAVRWETFVAWQRGPAPAPVRALLQAMPT